MKRTIATLAAATTLLLVGCQAQDGAGGEAPENSADSSESVRVEIELDDSGATPQGERVEVATGQLVELDITNNSSQDDEIHVHSDPEQSFDVAAGSSDIFTFSINRPGQVAVESHGLGVTIVQLVVE